MYTCSKDNTHIYKFIYKTLYLKTVYFTPMIPNLYVPRCGQLGGGIKLFEYFDTFKNGRFWWEDGEISQNALAFMANVSNRKRKSRNFPFDKI